MNKVYLLLGSNQQNPVKQLVLAKKLIARKNELLRQGSIYETSAWGNTNQPNFLNQVIVINTKLSAEKLMLEMLSIEKKMGRIRTKKNAPRIIDIDILFFNKEILNTALVQLPHPQIQNRKFVLIPLNELAPQFKHPVLQKTIHQLLRICNDTLDVKKL